MPRLSVTRTTMDIFTKILLLFLVINCINTQVIDEGESCFDEFDKTPGTCRRFEECDCAINNLRRGIWPQICSFIGDTSVVCCYDTDNSEPVINSPAPPTFGARLSVNGCNLPTDEIYGENDIGSRARKQCQSIVDTISKCSSVFKDCPRGGKIYLQVVGGKPAYKNEFPHMALLGYGEKPETAEWLCGGTLISNRWVMTAAHCLSSRSSDSDVKYVRLGVDKLKDPINNDMLFTIALIVEHPDRNPPQKYNDIALLQLDREVILGPAIIPACLHADNKYYNKGVITGWGVTKSKGQQSNSLLKTSLDQVSHEDCANAHPPSASSVNGVINDTQICYSGGTEFKDSCQGDSGGPIQTSNDEECTYTVIGIVSTGKGCAIPGIPGIYTRVASYIPWIEDIVWPRPKYPQDDYYQNW